METIVLSIAVLFVLISLLVSANWYLDVWSQRKTRKDLERALRRREERNALWVDEQRNALWVDLDDPSGEILPDDLDTVESQLDRINAGISTSDDIDLQQSIILNECETEAAERAAEKAVRKLKRRTVGDILKDKIERGEI